MPSVFKRSLPIILPYFINSCGTIGLSLLPMILVVQNLSVTVMAVFAARHIRNPRWAFPTGILLVGLGSYLTIISGANPTLLYLGAFVVTSGEIFFTALASFVMIHVTRPSKRRGSYYGLALVIQNTGRVLGGAAAFPMVVHGKDPISFIALTGAVGLLLTIVLVIRLDPKAI